MMQDLKTQNRMTHDFMRGDFASLLKMTAAAFAALMVLGFVLAFFFLLWKEHLVASAKKVFAAFLPKQMLIHLVDTVAFANRTFGRYFIGVIFDSLCLGIIIFFTLMILRFSTISGSRLSSFPNFPVATM